MKIVNLTQHKITVNDLIQLGHSTRDELIQLGGNLHCSDSSGRELWTFNGKYVERTVFDEKNDDWSVDNMEGWFPSEDTEEWRMMLLEEK